MSSETSCQPATHASTRRRIAAFVMSASLIALAACGGSDQRVRNVTTIAGTACTIAGTTKTVAKKAHVCGATEAGLVWFVLNGKLTTRGAKVCKKLGVVEAATSRVCAKVKSKKYWLAVQNRPGVLTPATGGPTTTTTPIDESSALKTQEELLRYPNDQPRTVPESLRQLVPRPVEPSRAAATATSLRVVSGPEALANGVGADKPFVVEVLDQDGDPFVAGGNKVTLSIDRTDLEVNATTAVTDAEGRAAFGEVTVNGVAGSATVTFAADFGASVERPITVLAGGATELRLLTNTKTVVAGKTFGVNPVLQLLDKDGNSVPSAGVLVEARVNKKPIGTAKTDASGRVEFANLQLTKKETTTVEYGPTDTSISDLTARESIEVLPTTAQKLVVLQSPTGSNSANVPFRTQPVVRIVDQFDNPVALEGVRIVAYPVVTTTIDEVMSTEMKLSGETAVTDAEGIARFADLTMNARAGSYGLGFDSERAVVGENFVSAKPDRDFDLVAGPVSAVTVTKFNVSGFRSGVQQQGPVFEFALLDASGNEVPFGARGRMVEIEILSTDQTLRSGDTGQIVGQRFQISDVIISGEAGLVYLEVTVPGLMPLQVKFPLAAGDPASLEVGVKLGTVVAGTKFPIPLAVQMLDGDGNFVRIANRAVRLVVSGANNATETVTTDERGVAVFALSTLTKAGPTDLAYSALVNGKVDSSVAAAADKLTVLAGEAATVKSLGEASEVVEQSGVVFPMQPRVQLLDENGNSVAKAGVTVIARMTFGVIGGRLDGTQARTDADGIATFTNLKINGPVGGYAVTFTPESGRASTRLSVRLDPGPVAKIRIDTQPSGAVNRSLLVVQPVVTLVDSFGNPIERADQTVTAVLDGQTYSSKTNSRGVANFVDIVPRGRVGTRRVTFRREALTAQSELFSMSAGPASAIMVGNSPLSLRSGGTVPDALVVDADGNGVAASMVVSVRVSSGTMAWMRGILNQATTDGRASFAGTTVSSVDSTATIVYSLSGTSLSSELRVSFSQLAQVGDVGPAGGVIMAGPGEGFDGVASIAVTGRAIITTGGRYIEVAPSNWSTSSDNPRQWSTNLLPVSSTATGRMGGGGTNTAAILDLAAAVNPLSPTRTAASIVAEASVNGFDDWVLPSNSEAQLLFRGVGRTSNNGLGLNMVDQTGYWTSSYVEVDSWVSYIFPTANWPWSGWGFESQTDSKRIRPVRYFG